MNQTIRPADLACEEASGCSARLLSTARGKLVSLWKVLRGLGAVAVYFPVEPHDPAGSDAQLADRRDHMPTDYALGGFQP